MAALRFRHQDPMAHCLAAMERETSTGGWRLGNLAYSPEPAWFFDCVDPSGTCRMRVMLEPRDEGTDAFARTAFMQLSYAEEPAPDGEAFRLLKGLAATLEELEKNYDGLDLRSEAEELIPRAALSAGDNDVPPVAFGEASMEAGGRVVLPVIVRQEDLRFELLLAPWDDRQQSILPNPLAVIQYRFREAGNRTRAGQLEVAQAPSQVILQQREALERFPHLLWSPRRLEVGVADLPHAQLPP